MEKPWRYHVEWSPQEVLLVLNALPRKGGKPLAFGLALDVASSSPLKKSRIRETKHLSTDANSSTDTTVEWTKNTL